MHSQLNSAAFLCLLGVEERENNKKAQPDDGWWKRNVAMAPKVSFPPPTEKYSVYLYKIDCADGFGLLNYSMFKSSPFTHSILSVHSYATEKICRRQRNFHFTKGEHENILNNFSSSYFL